MATQAEESTPTPQVVGNAFVEQYYKILSKSPEVVHKFYQNSSVISRPDFDGLMSSASTLDVSSLKLAITTYWCLWIFWNNFISSNIAASHLNGLQLLCFKMFFKTWVFSLAISTVALPPCITSLQLKKKLDLFVVLFGNSLYYHIFYAKWHV